jgi:transcriptional regulator with XRE-family HTH domain
VRTVIVPLTIRNVSPQQPSKGRYTPSESYAWVEMQMAKQGLASLEELSLISGIDREALSRYVRQEKHLSIDVIGALCEALGVAPETLLVALGAIDRK